MPPLSTPARPPSHHLVRTIAIVAIAILLAPVTIVVLVALIAKTRR